MDWNTRGNEVLQDFISGMIAAVEKENRGIDEDARSEYIDSEVLSIETHVHFEVILELGGPTSWIDFDCTLRDGKLTLYGATFKSRWGGHPPIDIVLETKDAEMLYDELGLAFIAVDANH